MDRIAGVALLFLSFAAPLYAQAFNGLPAKYQAPSKDSIAVYRAFLATYKPPAVNGDFYIHKFTEPLQWSMPVGWGGCRPGIVTDATPRKQVHQLDASILPEGYPARVADIGYDAIERHGNAHATGLRPVPRDPSLAEGRVVFMRLSEVVFDDSHRHAAMHYRFECGPLCSQSGIMLFRKEGDRWVSVDTCGERLS